MHIFCLNVEFIEIYIFYKVQPYLFIFFLNASQQCTGFTLWQNKALGKHLSILWVDTELQHYNK